LKLPDQALAALRQGECTERHARALLRLETAQQQTQAAQQVAQERLTVAQTEALVERLLAPPAPKKRPKGTFILKDVRLFLNTVTRSMDLMRSAGVNAQCLREDTDDAIRLTIQIPRHAAR
jgi:ParB family chromosome partitioning protein